MRSVLTYWWAQWSLMYYKAALSNLHPSHPDVPEIVHHIRICQDRLANHGFVK